MANIIPFKAVLPGADKVSLVTSRPYEEYSAAELAAQLDYNPYAFLHVLNPLYMNLQKSTNEKRFRLVKSKYLEFREQQILEQDEKPAFYLYEIKRGNQTFTGLIAATSIEDYRNDVIKKHEDTLQYRVELFKDYLHQTGFNTEPVLITYPENKALEDWKSAYKANPPLFFFATTNKDRHSFWRISSDEDIEWLQQEFAAMPSLYIADGHHRSASADMLYEEDKATGNEHLSYFMSFLISENDLHIYEYNRVVHDLNGLSKQVFLKVLDKDFIVENKGLHLWKPEKKGSFGMYLDDDFYSLQLKQKPEGSVLDRLDAQILYEKVLHPLLGIGDLRTDERIEYIPGTKPVTEIKEAIDNGEFKVGFMLYPVAINEIIELAENKLIMPPKSTYIEPKFRSGLVVYEI